MFLQNCVIFKEIHGKDSDKYWRIQVSDKFSDHTTELGKNLQNSNEETDGFAKLLTKDEDRDFPGCPVGKTQRSQAGGPCSIPDWGTRSRMPQLKDPTWHNEDPACCN